VEYYNEGYAAAMASGDVFLAAVNKHFLCAGAFFAGENLQVMRGKYAEAIKFMEERKQVIFMIHTQQQQHSIFKLIGIDEELKYISEEETILATNNSVMATNYYQKTYISFLFRSYDGTKKTSRST
jgi:hypothetical protein